MPEGAFAICRYIFVGEVLSLVFSFFCEIGILLFSFAGYRLCATSARLKRSHFL